MAYDGHILCPKCQEVLYLGKCKDGRFWPGKTDENQTAIAVLRFITEHFDHRVTVMGDDPFERYLDSTPESNWPTTVYIDLNESGEVVLTTRNHWAT